MQFAEKIYKADRDRFKKSEPRIKYILTSNKIENIVSYGSQSGQFEGFRSSRNLRCLTIPDPTHPNLRRVKNSAKTLNDDNN